MNKQGIPYYKWCYGKFILVGYIKEEKDAEKVRQNTNKKRDTRPKS